MNRSNLHDPGTSSNVRFLSWNVKGVNGPVKRTKIFSHLKRFDTDIAFLQETHLRNRDHFRLRQSWVGNIFHSNFDSKSRGVAILVNKRVNFSIFKTILDKNGRFLIVVGTLYSYSVLLVNIYALNFDDPNFMDTLFSNLPCLDTHLLIIEGDLNCVMAPSLGRSSPRTLTQSAMSKSISDFMVKTALVDPWRFANPRAKEYSFFSQVH